MICPATMAECWELAPALRTLNECVECGTLTENTLTAWCYECSAAMHALDIWEMEP